MKGKLIVMDGTDGSGKATQTKLLIEYLKVNGKEVCTFDFPRYDNPSSYFIKEYLNGKYGKSIDIPPKLASLFYALDRFDAKKELISALESGKIVISNRYVSSNIGHQGGKIKNIKERTEFITWLYNLEYGICKIPKPDIKIYLYLPSEIGQNLVEKKGFRAYIGDKKKDIHESDKNHLKDAENSYLELINNEKDWIKIDCISKNKLLSIKEIHDKIINHAEIIKLSRA